MLRSLANYCLTLVVLHATCIGVTAQENLPGVPVSVAKPDFINTLQQREWVSLNSEGVLAGKVNALSSAGELESLADVAVALMLEGTQVALATTDKEGAFAFAGVAPGTYALVAKSETAFSTYALHVLASGENLQTSLTVYAAKLGEQKTLELVDEHWVPTSSPALNYYRNHAADPLAETRKFNDSHRIRLQNNNLVGRVSRPGWVYSDQDLSGTVAHVFKNGEVVGTAPVEKDGYFTVAGIEPGVYDLFVAGDDGIAVIGFQAIDGESSVQKSSEGSVLVTIQAGCCDTLCCEMVQPCEVAAPVIHEEVVVSEPGCCGEVIGEPVMGGGFSPCCGGGSGGGGYGGGGGGGGGGLGGGGALLGLAGLAGLAALGSDDDFDPNQATIISP